MSEVRVTVIDAVPEGKAVVVEVGGKVLALFRYAGQFYALDDSCPHRGGPLHEGMIQEGVLACPGTLGNSTSKQVCRQSIPCPRSELTESGLMERTFVELGGP